MFEYELINSISTEFPNQEIPKDLLMSNSYSISQLAHV